MTTNSHIINEVEFQQVLIGTESVLGTAVTPDYRMYGDMQATKNRPLVQKYERRRSYDALLTPRYGPTTFTGTYAEELSFQNMPCVLRYGAITAPAGVSDGNATPGYTYDFEPGAATSFESFTAEFGIEGMVQKVSGAQWGEFTITHDIDDADGVWKFSSVMVMSDYDMKPVALADTATGGSTSTVVKTAAGWTVDAFAGQFIRMMTGTAANIGVIREIASNTADTITITGTFPSAVSNGDTFQIADEFTPSIAEREYDYIQNEGTQLFIADTEAGLATASNEITDKMISFSVTHNNNVKLKKFSDNIRSYSTKRGRAPRFISGTVVMEFDDWKEFHIFEKAFPDQRALKFQQINGPTIDSAASTEMAASIVIPNARWNAINPNQNRNGNITAAYEFWAYADTAAGYAVQYSVKNDLATLP